MQKSTPVFVLQHLFTCESDIEHVKMIGVYESRTAAEEAVGRLANQPGFRDNPDIVHPDDYYADGFYIDEYPIGKDHWAEGFVDLSHLHESE